MGPTKRRALLLLSILLGVVRCGREEGRPPNVLILGIDTLRADALGCYGAKPDASPNLDRFAADATRFENLTAAAPWTLPSFASMFTGLYPPSHGVETPYDKLDPEHDLLAERLKREGYRTAAFTGGAYLRPEFGFDQGFDRFEYRGIPRFRDKLAQGIEWMEDGGDEPFFLFLHGYDVHSPYRPDERPAAPAGYRPPKVGFARKLIDHVEGTKASDRMTVDRVVTAYHSIDPPTPDWRARFKRAYFGWRETLESPAEELWAETSSFARDLAWLEDNYAAEVRQLDADLAPLFDYLERSGRLEDTLIVIVSDHGEAFMEHGFLEHAVVHEEVVHAPLIVRAPGPAGTASGAQVVPDLVRGIDLTPTVLDVCGAPAPVEIEGRSLKPLLDGGSLPPVAAGSFQGFPEARGVPEASMRVNDWKLVSIGADGELDLLFDLKTDPAETTNLADAESDVLGNLRELLAATRARAGSNPGERADDLDEETLRELQELGYLGGK